MTTWQCAECETSNHADARFCDQCGMAKVTAVSEFDEYVPPWKRPGAKVAKTDDRCTEPGCTATVRQHIEECKRLTSRVLLRAIRF